MATNWNGERLVALETRMNVVEEGVSNFRDFHTEVREYLTEQKTEKRQRDKEHESNTARLNILIAIGILILTGVIAFTGWVAVHKASLDPSRIFHSQNPEPMLSSEAKIPQL